MKEVKNMKKRELIALNVLLVPNSAREREREEKKNLRKVEFYMFDKPMSIA